MPDTTDRDQLAEIIGSYDIGRDEGELEDCAQAIVDAGWRPPAHVIDKPDELTALPRAAVVHNGYHAYTHIGGGWWLPAGDHEATHSENVIEMAGGETGEAPATVLHTPGGDHA
jgi:hypothetical protein